MSKKLSLGTVLGLTALGVGGYVFLKSRPAKAASGIALPPNVKVVTNVMQAGLIESKHPKFVGVISDAAHRGMVERVVVATAVENPDVTYVIASLKFVVDVAKSMGAPTPVPDGTWGGVAVVENRNPLFDRKFGPGHGEEYVVDTLQKAAVVLSVPLEGTALGGPADLFGALLSAG